MKSTRNVGTLTSNTRWIRQRELRAFMILPVWLMGLRKLWNGCYQPLHDDILRLWKSNGPLWVSQYLSQVSRVILLWMGKMPYKCQDGIVRVATTRSGLPTILPAELRKIFHLLWGPDQAYALKVIRVTLTLLSVFRVIGCVPMLKIETITGLFSGMNTSLPVWEMSQAVGWLPRSLLMGRLSWTYMSESAGPNFKRSSWSSGLDAMAYLKNPLVWYHWIVVAWHQGAYKIITWNIVCVIVTLPLAPILMIAGRYPKYLGRLVTLFEARGKVRVVAITDWWTQIILDPLHRGIFDILRTIHEDGTFDQLAPVNRLIAYVRATGAPVFSYDLSAATDRFPIQFQVEVLKLLGVRWADSWSKLLVSRPWYLKGSAVYYAVGQPIGALSSWAMLAISHHIVVQIAASRAGWTEWFPHYALLGDDIIIADQGVAAAYRNIMHSLGVQINISKSFEMETGLLEFAKRWIHPFLGDISPMSPGLILGSTRNPRILATLFRDSLGRGFTFSTRVWGDLIRYLAMFRSPSWAFNQLGPILSSIFGPTGGLWDSASGPWFKAAWIGLFPSLGTNKLEDYVRILFTVISESQSPPPSEEDLKNQLVSNFWKRTALFGSG